MKITKILIMKHKINEIDITIITNKKGHMIELKKFSQEARSIVESYFSLVLSKI